MKDADRVYRRLMKEVGFQAGEVTIVCRDSAPGKPEREEGPSLLPAKADKPDERPPDEGSGKVVVDGLLGDLLGIVGEVVGATAPLVGVHGLNLKAKFAWSYRRHGVRKKEAERYDQAVDEGRILVVAECGGPDGEKRAAAVERIFSEEGADPPGVTKK